LAISLTARFLSLAWAALAQVKAVQRLLLLYENIPGVYVLGHHALRQLQ